MEVLTSALVAALANLSKTAVKDAYDALKSAIVRKFGKTGELAQSVESLEEAPDSPARAAVDAENAEKVELADNKEVTELLQRLVATLESEGVAPPGVSVSTNDRATVQGVVGAQNVVVGPMTFGQPKKG